MAASAALERWLTDQETKQVANELLGVQAMVRFNAIGELRKQLHEYFSCEVKVSKEGCHNPEGVLLADSDTLLTVICKQQWADYYSLRDCQNAIEMMRRQDTALNDDSAPTLASWSKSSRFWGVTVLRLLHPLLYSI